MGGRSAGRTAGHADGPMGGPTDRKAHSDGRADGRTDGRVNGRTDGRADRRAGERPGGRTDGRTDWWAHGRADGPMGDYGRTDQNDARGGGGVGWRGGAACLTRGVGLGRALRRTLLLRGLKLKRGASTVVRIDVASVSPSWTPPRDTNRSPATVRQRGARRRERILPSGRGAETLQISWYYSSLLSLQRALPGAHWLSR